MGRDQPFTFPADVLRGLGGGGDATDAWVSGLPAVAGDLLRRWELRADGTIRSGEAGVVVPVRRADGTPAVVKFQEPRAETSAAILGLTRWDGQGIVRLLDSDVEQGAMLLERLHGEHSLESVEDDDEAIGVVGRLLTRLHRPPAPEGLPTLAAVLGGMLDEAPAAMRSLGRDDRSRLHRWTRMVAELGTSTGTRLLHWDLHYGNVLSADREPWLAIDPEPLVGDPGFDLWPALDSGWSSSGTTEDASRIVRRRFDILTEMLSLDRSQAARLTIARLLQNSLWDIADGHDAVSAAAGIVDDALAPLAESRGR